MTTLEAIDAAAGRQVRARAAELLGEQIAELITLSPDPVIYHDLPDFLIGDVRIRMVGTLMNPSMRLVAPCPKCWAPTVTESSFYSPAGLRACIANPAPPQKCAKCRES